MLINFNHIKTFYNALIQKMKGFRGNWEQNDDTADDYIKNRTHWSEGVKEKVIIDWAIDFNSGEITSPMGTSGPIIYQAFIEDTSLTGFIVGQKYTVIWDNKTYECIAKDFNGIGIIGNESFIGYMDNSALEDTGEPFFIGIEEGYGGIVYITEADNHTCMIKTLTEVIHKLDKKFIDMPDLPDNLVTEDTLAPVAFSNDYLDLNNIENNLSLKENLVSDNFSGSSASLCYGNGVYVALHEGNSNNKLLYSTDGINWTDAYSLPTFAHWSSVCYGNGKFVAVGSSSSAAIYSTDGINWVTTDLPDSGYWKSVCYGNGIYVAVQYASTNKYIYSEDGINWILGNLPASNSCASVCYGDGKFVIVTGYQSSNNKAYFSTTGKDWEVATLPSSSNWQSVCYGNGLYMAVAPASQYAAYSIDGITWNRSKLPNLGWDQIGYGKNKFVACAAGAIAYSTDGIIWNTSTLSGGYTSNICYDDSKFILLNNYVYYSEDGINWTNKSIFQLDQNVASETADVLKPYFKSEFDNIQSEFENVQNEFDNVQNDIKNESDDIKTELKEYVHAPKFNFILTDEVNGLDYIICMKNGNLVSYRTTESISIATMPTKTTYLNKEEFDPTGMVVTATDFDGFTREITGYTYGTIDYDTMITPDGTCELPISYKEGNRVITTTVSLNVHPFTLIDFDYTANEDGTYTINDWKGTYNGEPSTKIIVPDSELIII